MDMSEPSVKSTSVKSTSDELFHDIRPYTDEEIASVLAKWQFCESWKQPMITHLFKNDDDIRLLESWFLRLPHVKQIADFQGILAELVEWLIDHTAAGVDVSGVNSLNASKAHLYLSNHRDIVLDPTLINYALAASGRGTARVAIGDNLVQNPLVGDLMRANKSFLVKRGLTDRREKLNELTKLSHYIRLSLQENVSVWLAQREGRAKDGMDLTETAVLKMLHLSARTQGLDVEQSFKILSVVPTTISYEWNPCDLALAQQRLGLAAKNDLEDIRSGLLGYKGKVHVHFGSEINADTIDSLAQKVDRQMHQQYWLFANNLVAYAKSEGADIGVLSSQPLWQQWFQTYRITEQALVLAEDTFNDRLKQVPEAVVQEIYAYYANPVRCKILASS
jgi:1-acyl-sn-glycerol-3-phosphate acyltransferase